jgi:hypothetical protein
MSHFVRSSKYRHVYVQAPRTGEAYSNIRLSTAVGEQNYVKANPKYFAVALSVRLSCGWVGGNVRTCVPRKRCKKGGFRFSGSISSS